MTKTASRNASGLPNHWQRSTARDMATLGLRIQRDFPHYYHFFKVKKFTYKGRTYRSHNKLLSRYSGTDGIKTGYKAGLGVQSGDGVSERSSSDRSGVRWQNLQIPRQTYDSLLNRGFKKVELIAHRRTPAPIPVARPDFDENGIVQLASAPSSIADASLQIESLSAIDRSWGIQVGAYSTKGLKI